MDDRTVLVVGDDTTSQQLRAMLTGHNIKVLGAGLAAGLPLDRAKPKAPPVPTEQDRRALAAAEEKRQRRAAKRQHRATANGAAGQADGSGEMGGE